MLYGVNLFIEDLAIWNEGGVFGGQNEILWKICDLSIQNMYIVIEMLVSPIFVWQSSVPSHGVLYFFIQFVLEFYLTTK